VARAAARAASHIGEGRSRRLTRAGISGNLYYLSPMASLTLDWLHVVVLLGAIQGVFLAGVLATKRSNRTANRLLAATMLAFSIYLASSAYHAAGYVQVVPHFFGAGWPMPFLFGPLVYLYAVAAADRSRRLTRRDVLHFVPFVAAVVAGLPVYLQSGAGKIAFYAQLQAGTTPLFMAIADPLKYVSGVTYTAATIVFLRRHRDRVKQSYSSLEQVNLRWLLWLGAAGAGIWMLAVAIRVLPFAGLVRDVHGDDYVSLAVAVLVYGIGYMGLRQPEIFRYETAGCPVPAPPRVAEADAPPPGPEADAPRYERSGLTGREAERLKDALTAVMDEERPWQDSGLTLADLAARLSTSPHKLSEVLNSQLHQTFYDFVNGYRVREVQRRIAAGEARRVTILSLALDAGFASKSTFNLVFRKHTNQTPSEYRQAGGL
jgi:AraC-like DNA-binding protein